MDNGKHRRRGNYNGHILLLTVLIGFCILAILEIAYGQAQIRMEKERLALEQENHQTVQELKQEWNSLKGDPSVGEKSAEKAGGEQSGKKAATEKKLVNTENTGETLSANTVSENTAEDEKKYDMQIVFLGDSILDRDRDLAGVAGLIGEECNAKVYNLAVGGTMAALLPDEPAGYDQWNSQGLLGVVNAILGNIDPALFDGLRAGENMRACDFSKTDYFIIEYGINDFQSGRIPQSKYLEDGEELAVRDVNTYTGALEIAVNMLRDSFPDAKIVIVSPHFCQFFNGDTFVGDAYSVNYGYGTLVDFFRSAGYVAEQHKKDNVLFFNAMEQSGIDAYTADQYLEDGIHLTEAGRRQYAGCLSRLILGDFYPEE